MHISDGIISLEAAAVTAAASFLFCAYTLKQMPLHKSTQISIFSALFFIASFIHIPLGPTQVHLTLVGFIAIFLGKFSVLAIAIALLFQALLLGFGGLSSLGANIFIMGFASYATYLIFKFTFLKNLNAKLSYFLVGVTGVLISSFFLFIVLVLSSQNYLKVASLAMLANMPIAILEGFVTLFLFLYLEKAYPEIVKESRV